MWGVRGRIGRGARSIEDSRRFRKRHSARRALLLWAAADPGSPFKQSEAPQPQCTRSAEWRTARKGVTLLSRNDRGFPAILSEIAWNSRHFWLKRPPAVT